MDDILAQLSAILFIAIIINILLRKFHITTIIGYIITGIVAKLLFGFHENQQLANTAEFGVVFLMFMIGLEFSIPKLLAMRKEVISVGGTQVLATSALMFPIIYFVFNLKIEPAIAVALTLAFSSTTMVLKLLQESGKMSRNHGRVSIGILLMQDIAVVPVLILLTLFAQQDVKLADLLRETVTNSLAGVMAIYIFGKYGVSFFLTHVAGARSSEMFMTAVLLIVLCAAGIAHFFHVPYSIGAFIAGVIISESAYKYQIEADLVPFRDLLLGLFFISIGLMIDIKIVINNITLILALALAIMAIKTLVIFVAARGFGYSGRTSIKSALLLSQVGEFGFVIFTFAKELSILGEFSAQILIAVTAVTMFIMPFIAKYIEKISYKFAKSIDAEIAKKTSDFSNHVAVIGLGYTGKSVVKELQQLGISYIAVEAQPDLVYDGQARGYNVIFGNATQKNILETLRVEKAAAVIVTIDNEKDLLSFCEIVKSNYPKVTLVALTRSEREFELIRAVGVSLLVNESGQIGRKLVDMALTCDISKMKHSQESVNYDI